MQETNLKRRNRVFKSLHKPLTYLGVERTVFYFVCVGAVGVFNPFESLLAGGCCLHRRFHLWSLGDERRPGDVANPRPERALQNTVRRRQARTSIGRGAINAPPRSSHKALEGIGSAEFPDKSIRLLERPSLSDKERGSRNCSARARCRLRKSRSDGTGVCREEARSGAEDFRGWIPHLPISLQDEPA